MYGNIELLKKDYYEGISDYLKDSTKSINMLENIKIYVILI